MKRSTLVLLVALVGCVYLFIVSAGTFIRWPTYSNYYDLQAEGFRAGHLYLPIEPSPQLLAKADPFDPANASLWVWDASLHGGRYYLYWGPLPALIQAGIKSLLGIRKLVGDQYLLFGFCLLYLGAGAWLIDRLARTLFEGIPRSLVVLAILVFAFANPIPHSLASPSIYQTAILSAQALLLAGLCSAFAAFERRTSGREPGRVLLVAGVLWALALACRISVAPAVALLVGVTALLAPKGARLASLARLSAPGAIAVFCLLLYNQLRFGEWLEFGAGLQLSTMRFETSASYVPLNLFSYMCRPLDLRPAFPYAFQVRDIGERGFPGWLPLQPGYSTAEPVVGFLLALPWSWLASLGVLAGVFHARRGGARGRIGSWCAASFLVLAAVAGLPELPLFIATMRYLGDVTAGIVLLGILGGFWWCSRPSPWRRAVLFAIGAATIVLGLLLGYQGYEGHFKIHNPDLHERIERYLSFGPGS